MPAAEVGPAKGPPPPCRYRWGGSQQGRPTEGDAMRRTLTALTLTAAAFALSTQAAWAGNSWT